MTHSQAMAPLVPTQRPVLERRRGYDQRHASTRHTPPRSPRREQRTGRRIIDQLRLIVAVPLVAVVAFAGIALITTAQNVSRIGQLQRLATLASDAGGLAHALQRERAAAASVLLNPAPSQLDAFNQQATLTDDTLRTYQQGRTDTDDKSDVLRRIDTGLTGLAGLRDQVRKDARASVSAVAFSYRIVIADLLSFRESVARAGAPTELADQIRAAAALSRASEALGQQQVAVLRAVAAGQLTPAMLQEITATRTGFVEATVSFGELASDEWRGWYERGSIGDKVLAAQRLQDDVGRAQPGQAIRLDTSGWIDAMSGWSQALFEVQQQVDAAVLKSVDKLRNDQTTQAMAQIAGVTLVLLVAIVLTGIVARRITRRLRSLHDAARIVAYEQLPSIVAELRAAAPGTVDPEEVADRASSTLVVGGADEVADVAQAFRAVHREAVRIAGEQAVMRSNVSEIFVHLSRREQRLVDAVLAQVDRVERDETDPDRLQQLYQLDHLATRMARINLSLLVLGGSGAARVRREDAPLGKVLQAAISQIEHYTRVRFGSVDDDVAVVAEAVDEIVHLLAELLDNATGYSPPESEVLVTARALGDRIIVQIADEGVGLAPSRREQLNHLLAAPPAIDIAAVRAMGLTVVGHIAARYRVGVELRPGQASGTLAEVTLPKLVFRPIMPAERHLQYGDPLHDVSERAAELFRPAGFAPSPALTTPTLTMPALPNLFAVPEQSFGTAVPPPPVGRRAGAQAGGPPGPGAWPPLPEPSVPVILSSHADDTTELPIFQEVNGWFRTEAPSGLGIADEPTNWESLADFGWRAAAQAAVPDTSVTTTSGLPLRAPQRHLVPGAAAPLPERPAGTPKRDPSVVAAAMSAYARGVAGRRTRQ